MCVSVEPTDGAVQAICRSIETTDASPAMKSGAKRAYLPAASRSRSTSRMGGCPNSLLYSRLNCDASS